MADNNEKNDDNISKGIRSTLEKKHTPKDNSYNLKKEKEDDKAKLQDILRRLKQYANKGETPPPELMISALLLAEKYPGETSFQELLDRIQAEQKAAIETSIVKIISPSKLSLNEFKDLVARDPAKASEVYLQEKTETIEFFNKLEKGALINDNDPTGESITSAEFIKQLKETTSDVSREKRHIMSSAACKGLESLEQEETKRKLTSKEEEKKASFIRTGGLTVKEFMHDIVCTKHKEELAKELHHEVSDEELTKHRGNHILQEDRENIELAKDMTKGNIHELTAVCSLAPDAMKKLLHGDKKSEDVVEFKDFASRARNIISDKVTKEKKEEQSKIEIDSVEDKREDKQKDRQAEIEARMNSSNIIEDIDIPENPKNTPKENKNNSLSR
jgi:hypothetical protein